jgi:hypothetical protein
MIEAETERVWESKNAKDDHGKGDAPFADSFAKAHIVASPPDQNVCKAGSNEKHAQNSGRCNKGEEVAIVASSDTVVEPDAVMILRFYAVVADTTVVGARRAPNVAAFAVLGGYFHC